MNPSWTIRLAPLLGRARAYATVMSHLRMLRHDRELHEHECRSVASRWSLNWESGSRASQLRDYRFLNDVLDELASNHESFCECTPAIQAIVRDLEARVSDDTRYRVDGRSLKSVEDANERVALADALRSRLRELAPRLS